MAELYGVVLLFFRAIGLVVALPLSGPRGIPRLTIAMIISSLGWSAELHVVDLSVNYFVQEFLIGYILALPLTLCVEFLGMFCGLAEQGRGATIAMIYDPTSNKTLQPLAVLGRNLMIALLFCSGACVELVSGFVSSLTLLPIGTFSHSPIQFGTLLLQLVIPLLGSLFSAFIPLATLYLIVEFGFGLVAKAAPQLLTIGESFQMKSLLLFALLSALLHLDLLTSLVPAAEGWKPLLQQLMEDSSHG